MPKNRIECSALSAQGISHGFFTRKGGKSQGLYSSLNCGFGSKDEPDNVQHNRTIVAKTLGMETAPIITPYQHHSADVIVATKEWSHKNAPKADAIVTKAEKLIIGILTADCAPVLFVDPKTNTIGAAHAGWRGAIAGVLENTVETMVKLGAQRRHITATIGPSLSVKNFEVGAEFYDHFVQTNPKFEKFFIKNSKTNKHHFDLKDFAHSKLLKTGIREVHTLPQCTYEDESLFFSYRRNTHQSHPDYGRQISVIAIN